MNSKIFLLVFVSLFLISFVSAYDNSLQNGILRHFNLDEGSGTTVLDSTGTANGIRNSSTTQGITGKIDYAYNFTGASGPMVTMGATVTATSFNFWVFPQNYSPSKTLFFNPNDNHAVYMEVGGYLRIFRNPSDVNTTIKAPTGQWSMVTFRHNGTGYLVSVNNGTEAYVVVSAINLNEFGGRSTSATQNYNGAMDHISIWNRNITTAEINTLYNNTYGYNYSLISITQNSPASSYTAIAGENVTFNWSSVSYNQSFTNTSIYINGTINQTLAISGNNSNNTIGISTFASGQAYTWLAETCSSTTCRNSTSRTFSVGELRNNSLNYSASLYDTQETSFVLNLTYAATISSISATFEYNNTNYSVTNTGSGTNAIFNATIDLPLIYTSTSQYKSGQFYVTTVSSLSGTTVTTYGGINQTVNATNFSICDGSLTTRFLNISFKDEGNNTVLQASIPSSTFNYYIGNGDTYKTLSYTSSSNSFNYTFCGTPTGTTLRVEPYVQYKQGTSYPQRIWNPSVQSYTSAFTNQTLYLLSSVDGLYVTYQFLNSQDQLLSNVDVTIAREISGVWTNISSGTTGSSGTVTFWLNPDFQHMLNATKSGYSPYSVTDTYTQDSYTITLSGTSDSVASDYTQGISTYISPRLDELVNDTAYTFTFNVTSSYWDLDSFGFSLRLDNGTIVGSASSSVEGTAATLNYNVNNQTIVYMDFYWIIEGNTTEGSTYWTIYNTQYSSWSIANFITDLNNYLDTGIFGLDSFGKNLIVFIILFLSIGTLTYKYGVNSPLFTAIVSFLIIFLFDIVFGLIPTIMGREHLLVYVTGIILVVIALRESQT